MKRLLLFAALIAWSGMAGAVVYKWLDAQGKVQYGDRPPNGVHAEVVEGLGAHVVELEGFDDGDNHFHAENSYDRLSKQSSSRVDI